MLQLPFGICPYCGAHLTPGHKCFEIGQYISRQEAITIANKILSDAEAEAERLVDND